MTPPPRCSHRFRRTAETAETADSSTFRCEICLETTTCGKIKPAVVGLTTRVPPDLLCLGCGRIARAASFRSDEEECHSCFWTRVDAHWRRR